MSAALYPTYLPGPEGFLPMLGLASVFVLLAPGVGAWSTWSSPGPVALMNACVVFEVVTGLGIGLWEQAQPWQMDGSVRGISFRPRARVADIRAIMLRVNARDASSSIANVSRSSPARCP